MKVLIASDKFKGTLTAKEVADLISEGLSDHECVLKPVADGGEGTSDCLLYTSPSPRHPKTSRMPSSA